MGLELWLADSPWGSYSVGVSPTKAVIDSEPPSDSTDVAWRVPAHTAPVPPQLAGVGRTRSTVHARLRDETSELHQALEQRLALLDPHLELPRYDAVLHAMYGYYAALEPRLVQLSARALELPFPLLERTPRIGRDLVNLGWRPDQVQRIEPCDVLPALVQVEHLAGCLYVIEGAALGGRVIARTLHQRFRFSSERGCAFFAGDRHGVGTRWQSVLGWLAGLPASGVSADGIVQSAQETFGTLTRWLERRGALQ